MNSVASSRLVTSTGTRRSLLRPSQEIVGLRTKG